MIGRASSLTSSGEDIPASTNENQHQKGLSTCDSLVQEASLSGVVPGIDRAALEVFASLPKSRWRMLAENTAERQPIQSHNDLSKSEHSLVSLQSSCSLGLDVSVSPMVSDLQPLGLPASPTCA